MSIALQTELHHVREEFDSKNAHLEASIRGDVRYLSDSIKDLTAEVAVISGAVKEIVPIADAVKQIKKWRWWILSILGFCLTLGTLIGVGVCLLVFTNQHMAKSVDEGIHEYLTPYE